MDTTRQDRTAWSTIMDKPEDITIRYQNITRLTLEWQPGWVDRIPRTRLRTHRTDQATCLARRAAILHLTATTIRTSILQPIMDQTDNFLPKVIPRARTKRLTRRHTIMTRMGCLSRRTGGILMRRQY